MYRALYGCEAWTLRSAEEKQLLVFEMTALRKILGVHIIDKMRNDDIRKALNQTETIMKNVQHQWLGHVLRMIKNRIANITNLKTEAENIEKITCKIVQIKFLVMHITNKKLSFDMYLL